LPNTWRRFDGINAAKENAEEFLDLLDRRAPAIRKLVRSTMRSRSHQGTNFEIWNAQQTWFWLVANPHRNGGAIGAAATEEQAVREACSSIEVMSAHRRAGAAASPVIEKVASAPAIQESDPISFAAIRWNESLANLDRYLTRICDQFA
jgi:hypothetical protein